MRQALLIAASVLLLALAFVCGRVTARKSPVDAPQVQRDTITLHDTLRLVPAPVTRYISKTEYIRAEVRDTIRLRDTLYLELPREVKAYSDSLFACEVSGYRPELDWIELYPRTEVITETRTQTIPKKMKPRISIGLQAGYGIPIAAGAEPAPYIGIGVQYNILSFGYK